jgi:hypothetical protein
MTTAQGANMRDLNNVEMDQVSGGNCTCGDGAACVSYNFAEEGGVLGFFGFNCAGTMVYSSFLVT